MLTRYPYPCPQEETCIKPIGELAQLIERTSLEDLLLFTIAIGKNMNRANHPIESIIIGFND